MNAAHLHLVITHFPITGFFFALLMLLYGHFSQKIDIKQGGLYLVIFCGICSALAYFSGENAEEIAESFGKEAHFYLELHEDAAKFSLLSGVVSGILAALTLFMMQKNRNVKTMFYLVLISVIVAFAFLARTGSLGGQIRHSELRDKTPPSSINQNEGKHSKHDDD